MTPLHPRGPTQQPRGYLKTLAELKAVALFRRHIGHLCGAQREAPSEPIRLIVDTDTADESVQLRMNTAHSRVSRRPCSRAASAIALVGSLTASTRADRVATVNEFWGEGREMNRRTFITTPLAAASPPSPKETTA